MDPDIPVEAVVVDPIAAVTAAGAVLSPGMVYSAQAFAVPLSATRGRPPAGSVPAQVARVAPAASVSLNAETVQGLPVPDTRVLRNHRRGPIESAISEKSRTKDADTADVVPLNP